MITSSVSLSCLIGWISDTLSQGYTALQSLVTSLVTPQSPLVVKWPVVQGIYGDLVPGWYAQVGQSLFIVIVFTVGLPHPAFVLYRYAAVTVMPVAGPG